MVLIISILYTCIEFLIKIIIFIWNETHWNLTKERQDSEWSSQRQPYPSWLDDFVISLDWLLDFQHLLYMVLKKGKTNAFYSKITHFPNSYVQTIILVYVNLRFLCCNIIIAFYVSFSLVTIVCWVSIQWELIYSYYQIKSI